MSIINQLVEEVEISMIKGEGMLRLIEKIPNQEIDIWSKIKDIAVLKENQYKSKQLLTSISEYIKIDGNPLVQSEIKENEIYIVMCVPAHYYYILYIKNIWKETETVKHDEIIIGGKTLSNKDLQCIQYSFSEFTRWKHYGQYTYFHVIDEKFIEEERRKIDIN